MTLTRDPPAVLSIVFQIIYLLLYVFFLTLLARFVLGAVLQYGRRWQPGDAGVR